MAPTDDQVGASNAGEIDARDIDLMFWRVYTDLKAHLSNFPELLKHLEDAKRKWPAGSQYQKEKIEGLRRSLIEALSTDEARLRAGAIHAIQVLMGRHHISLGTYKMKREAVAALCKAVADTDVGTRDAALQTLEVLAGSSAVNVLVVQALAQWLDTVEMLDSATALQIRNILMKCGRDAASVAVDSLLRVLGETTQPPEVRTVFCEILGSLADDARQAADVLLKVVLTNEPDSELCLAAMHALVSIEEDLPAMLTGRKLTPKEKTHILDRFRQLGSKGRTSRKALEGMWTHDSPPPATPSWTFRPGEAYYRGVRIPVSGIEWKLLKALVDARGGLTRDELIEAGWPHDSLVEANTVRTHLSTLRSLLRRKLGRDEDPIPLVDRGELAAWRLHSDLR